MRNVTTLIISIIALVALLLLCSTQRADAADQDPFANGSMRLSVLVGNGYAFDESYLIIGVGFGYYLMSGLELGLDFESWQSGSPGITKISPAVRYVVPTNSPIRPYIGAFYRRTIIDNYDDLDSVGGRAGIYFMSGRGSYFGAGVVYEQYLSCDKAVYKSCDATYPEFIFAIAF